MSCTQCATAIPDGQPICPRCYARAGDHPVTPAKARRARVLLVLPEPNSSRYADLYHRHLQERVEVMWQSADIEQMDAAATDLAPFDLVILDGTFAEVERDAVARVLTRLPDAVVAAEYAARGLPPSPPLAGAIVFEEPGEIDARLALLHGLLDTAGAPRTR